MLLVERNLSSISDEIKVLSADSGRPEDTCLIQQYKEKLSDIKIELKDIHNSLLPLDIAESDELSITQSRLDKMLFTCSLSVKKLPEGHVTRSPQPDRDGVKLPKLEVPTFSGDVTHWKSFWEQFCVSVHDRPSLTDPEKLVYLQHALKDGTAKHVIEGLSRSGEYYQEAIDCLKLRYDRPRLVHRTHVQKILEAPPLKEGTGKELRRLHDTMQQHLRALKTLKHEPSSSFITSVLELKLDANTMFEWQKHSQTSVEVPHYRELLEFLNLRAQASETHMSEHKRPSRSEPHHFRRVTNLSKLIASLTASATENTGSCVLCKNNKHPLYVCPKFKSQPHDRMVSILKENNLCLNCLRPGHFVRQCRSSHRCRKCQRPHHTLLHLEASETASSAETQQVVSPVSSNTATGLTPRSLLMTCRVLIHAPNGSSVEARALLDNASSASFVTERLAQNLCLPRSSKHVSISGIAGIAHRSSSHSISHFAVSAVRSPRKKIDVTAIIVPRVTCDLPFHPVPFDANWRHLNDIPLADPSFGIPGRIDILLGVDVFVQVLLHGRRIDSPEAPIAFETEFGWVLAGQATTCQPTVQIASHHTLHCLDDVLQKFWEVEESPTSKPALSPDERIVVEHFRINHSRTSDGRFIVPLPKRSDTKPLGESRSQAVRRFLCLERSLQYKGQTAEFNAAMSEYFDSNHAEAVVDSDLDKPPRDVFYLPMHVVYKESSSTTKMRIVFDASAESSTGVALNDMLLVGPTVHPSLVDVLLRFRLHRVALTADVSRMYRAISLPEEDRDFHRFVYRRAPEEPLQEYRMTRITFGVSASSFAANMAVKQNAIDHSLEYSLAAKIVHESFYVDDCLAGADSVDEAIGVRTQLQDLFSRGGFILRKWNSSEQAVLQSISPELIDTHPTHLITDPEGYTKTLGVQWNASLDSFRLTVANLPPLENVTKRFLVSDVAKTFDVLGWFAPSIIKAKILLQRLWEQKLNWDDPVPQPTLDAWLQWRSELDLLTDKTISRCYFPNTVRITSIQLHGFSDASELAYAGVVYLRMMDSKGEVHTSLVISKTRVAPIKRLTIPRLELCGAHLLAKLLHHVREVLCIPLHNVYAWTDSTIVLNWLDGNPRRFKTYVGNRISCVMELVPPKQWNHVNGSDNPADCASRGLFPSELLEHPLWWNGPDWLKLTPEDWPKQSQLPQVEDTDEEKEICLSTTVVPETPVIDIQRYSNSTKLKRITAWILRFIRNCRSHRKVSTPSATPTLLPLTVEELTSAEGYWLLVCQRDHFMTERELLERKKNLSNSSCLLPLHPFLDSSSLLRVGGRQQNSNLSYSRQHPIILHGNHPVTKLIIHSEHLRLLHAGPQLVTSVLSTRFHIIGYRKVVRDITRSCVVCRRNSVRPKPQLLGQLPMERVTPDSVFDRVGIDYAGPLYVKYGHVRKPKIVKAYVCVFVSLSVKAVHLELVSDLTTDAFLACLRRFIARRGMPKLIWSDHGTNFVGAARELKELVEFFDRQKTQEAVAHYCTTHHIEWRFIPEKAPHFGGIWEAAVKSFKMHLRRVVGDVKLTFEETMTVLAQIEACLNSRPLCPNPCDDDGIEALTPGHFIIGRPLASLPDPSFSYRSISLLKRWHLCQSLVRHFWRRWHLEYLTHLQKFSKWRHPSRNARVGDVVVLHENGLVPGKWPVARVTEVKPGRDGIVRVVTVRTHSGTYNRPVTKIALLLPSEN